MDKLKNQIDLLQREIYRIDNKSIYSLSYYFIDEGEKRAEFVSRIRQLELEIQFLKDDMKREKYRTMRDRDPLKMGKRK
jgi:hypothetical protein